MVYEALFFVPRLQFREIGSVFSIQITVFTRRLNENHLVIYQLNCYSDLCQQWYDKDMFFTYRLFQFFDLSKSTRSIKLDVASGRQPGQGSRNRAEKSGTRSRALKIFRDTLEEASCKD